MNIGFTGTRHGMTLEQGVALRHRLVDIYAEGQSFHHGCCVGADEEFVGIVQDLFTSPTIHGYPGSTFGLISGFARDTSTFVAAEEDNLARNRKIVDASDVLLAAPQGMTEELRSGTWSTVRYARKSGKPVVIFFPDGSTIMEGRQ